jgi:hypothetical protein
MWSPASGCDRWGCSTLCCRSCSSSTPCSTVVVRIESKKRLLSTLLFVPVCLKCRIPFNKVKGEVQVNSLHYSKTENQIKDGCRKAITNNEELCTAPGFPTVMGHRTGMPSHHLIPHGTEMPRGHQLQERDALKLSFTGQWMANNGIYRTGVTNSHQLRQGMLQGHQL